MALVDGGDYGAVGCPTVLVEHPKINQVGVGGDALQRARAGGADGIGAVPSHDACHVRAVTIKVIRAGAHKILAVDDAAGPLGRQIINRGDPTIDNRHADPRTIEVQLPSHGGIHRGGGQIQLPIYLRSGEMKVTSGLLASMVKALAGTV